MAKNSLFKIISLVGLAVGGIGTLISNWADDKQQDKIIEEKVNEAIAARNSDEEEVEEP